MNDSLLKQFSSRVPAPPDRRDADIDAADDLVAFGYLRGVRDRALMLELRKRDGGVTALGYGWLERIEFDPSAGITLKFVGQTVKIVGRNLNAEVRTNVRLLDGLVRQRISWIQESGGAAAMTAAKEATIVERIEFS
jgi:hypothetical protein